MAVPDVVIFEGSRAASPVENMLVQVRHAAFADNLEKLLSLPEVNRVIIVTNQPGLALGINSPRVTFEFNDIAPPDFHFGQQLVSVVERYKIEALLYLGGAAVPLISAQELAAACRRVLESPGCFVTNNVQSADMLAFAPASVLRNYPPPHTDNALCMLLRYDARFEQVLLPATLGTQFDIDTPTDALILADSPFGGAQLRRTLNTLQLDTKTVREIKKVLRGEYLELALAGRIGAPAIARLNSNFKVRLRIFSEERGMKALGRVESGKVVSLLGYWLLEIGPERFFDYLARTVQAALLDTRVLFTHLCGNLSDSDRFYSDLGLYEEIRDPWTREFTRAAVNCGIPVLMGGHSLVTGGVWALVEELGCLL